MDQSSHQTLEKLIENRNKLEEEFNTYVPIICNLKGNLVRVGNFTESEVFLKQGQ